MKIKPFTCFLFVFAVILIAVSPWLIQSYYSEEPEIVPYKGILTLWNITDWRTGGSSPISFLKKRVAEFESRSAHIFIDVENMTPEEAAAAVQNGETPDMISYPYGFDAELQLTSLPHKNTIFPQIPGNAYPYMCGGYCIILNTDMLDREGLFAPSGWGIRPDELIDMAKLGVCFDSESGYSALPAIAVHKYPDEEGSKTFTWEKPAMPEAALNLSVVAYSDGVRLFRTEQACTLIASHNQLFELGKLLEDSSAPSFRPYALGGYTDMVQLISVVSCEDEKKQEACTEFAGYLLRDSVQKKIEALGVFPVLPGLEIYEDNECLYMMYELLSEGALLPEPEDRQKLGELSMSALGGSGDALGSIRRLLGF
jgi:hypothetical protein